MSIFNLFSMIIAAILSIQLPIYPQKDQYFTNDKLAPFSVFSGISSTDFSERELSASIYLAQHELTKRLIDENVHPNLILKFGYAPFIQIVLLAEENAEEILNASFLSDVIEFENYRQLSLYILMLESVGKNNGLVFFKKILLPLRNNLKTVLDFKILLFIAVNSGKLSLDDHRINYLLDVSLVLLKIIKRDKDLTDVFNFFQQLDSQEPEFILSGLMEMHLLIKDPKNITETLSNLRTIYKQLGRNYGLLLINQVSKKVNAITDDRNFLQAVIIFYRVLLNNKHPDEFDSVMSGIQKFIDINKISNLEELEGFVDLILKQDFLLYILKALKDEGNISPNLIQIFEKYANANIQDKKSKLEFIVDIVKEENNLDVKRFLIKYLINTRLIPLTSDQLIRQGGVISARDELRRIVEELIKSSYQVEEELMRLLESVILSDPTISWEVLIVLLQYFPPEKLKYIYYYLTEIHFNEIQTSDIPPLSEFFPLSEKIKSVWDKKNTKVLIVHNIADGMGDEIIRNAILMESLLRYSSLEITVYTNRPFLYSHPRIKVYPLSEKSSFLSQASSYDIVIDHYDPVQRYDDNWAEILTNFLKDNPPQIYVNTTKDDDSFIPSKVTFKSTDGKTHEIKVFSDRMNVYTSVYHLCAELGLAALPNIVRQFRNSLFVNLPNEKSEKWWEENVENKNMENRPVLVVNFFGGEHPLKGLYDTNDILANLAKIVSNGSFVVILSTHQSWGSEARAQSIVDRLIEVSPQYKDYLVVAPEPGKDPLLHKYILAYSDGVSTIEGGIMHLSILMGKSVIVSKMIGSGSFSKWVTPSISSDQIISRQNVDDVNVVKQYLDEIEALISVSVYEVAL